MREKKKKEKKKTRDKNATRFRLIPALLLEAENKPRQQEEDERESRG